MTLVVEYDSCWPEVFRAESARILAALGDAALAVEHVGSTAVPGLAAKPIVDIAVAVDSFARSGMVPALEALGYEYVAEYERELPRRRYFRREGFHVHVYEAWDEEFLDYLRFRDHLRADVKSARAYAELKARLAEGGDRRRYQEAKRPFVEEVLTRIRS